MWLSNRKYLTMHFPHQTAAGESTFLMPRLRCFTFNDQLWILIPNLLYSCSLFPFWINPLSLYRCNHLANEPILRQWPLPPIKALKPSEDLLGQERKREMEINIGQQTRKNDWGDSVRIWCGLCSLRNIYSRFWSPQVHEPLHVTAWACDHWTRLSSAARGAQKNDIANQKLDSSAAVIKCAGSACSPACLCCKGRSREMMWEYNN